MKKFRRTLIVLAAIAVIGTISITSLAAGGFGNPAQTLADLTNQNVEDVEQAKVDTGDTYCEMATDAGVYDEFQAARIDDRTDVIESRVADGTLTQEEADEIIADIEERMADCDGTCEGLGGLNLGLGSKNGMGNRGASGYGQGSGTRGGNGTGLRDGSCGLD